MSVMPPFGARSAIVLPAPPGRMSAGPSATLWSSRRAPPSCHPKDRNARGSLKTLAPGNRSVPGGDSAPGAGSRGGPVGARPGPAVIDEGHGALGVVGAVLRVADEEERGLGRAVIGLDDVGGSGGGVVDLLSADLHGVLGGDGLLFGRGSAGSAGGRGLSGLLLLGGLLLSAAAAAALLREFGLRHEARGEEENDESLSHRITPAHYSPP